MKGPPSISNVYVMLINSPLLVSKSDYFRWRHVFTTWLSCHDYKSGSVYITSPFGAMLVVIVIL